MKKLITIITAAILAAALTACTSGNNGNNTAPGTLSVISMRDTELDLIITLGDTQESVEAALGQPHEFGGFVIGDGAILLFENGMEVAFEHGLAIEINAVNHIDHGRFEIYGFAPGTPLAELSQNFTLLEEMSEAFSNISDGSVYYYVAFTDAQGNPTELEQAYFARAVVWEEGPNINQVILTVVSYE